MEKSIITKARVKLTLEVSLPDTWRGDCPLSQIYKQAKDSAINIISQRITASMKDIRIIGNPEAVVIIIEE